MAMRALLLSLLAGLTACAAGGDADVVITRLGPDRFLLEVVAPLSAGEARGVLDAEAARLCAPRSVQILSENSASSQGIGAGGGVPAAARHEIECR